MIELWSISDLIPLAQGEMSKDSKLCLDVEVDFRTIRRQIAMPEMGLT